MISSVKDFVTTYGWRMSIKSKRYLLSLDADYEVSSGDYPNRVNLIKKNNSSRYYLHLIGNATTGKIFISKRGTANKYTKRAFNTNILFNSLLSCSPSANVKLFIDRYAVELQDSFVNTLYSYVH